MIPLLVGSESTTREEFWTADSMFYEPKCVCPADGKAKDDPFEEIPADMNPNGEPKLTGANPTVG